MTLLNLAMEPSMSNVADGSFFEEIVRAFMELDNDLETALPCTIYLSVCDKIGIGIPTRLGRLGQFRPCPNCASVAVPTTLTMPLVLGDKVPADISELMQLCDKPPLLCELYYCFSYHFCNHRIGHKLFMDFFYRPEPVRFIGRRTYKDFFCQPEPNDIRGWVMMRYGVDSVLCCRSVDRLSRRRQAVLHGDVLLDALALLNCDAADTAQLVCRSWKRTVDANPGVLPLRQLAEVQVETVAPKFCRVMCRLSSIAFVFRRHVSFDDLGLFLQAALKRGRIALLELKDDLDDYISFGLVGALSLSSVFVKELRLDFRCDYKAETLATLCTEAVNVWNTTVLGLYNPQHSQTIFGDAEITRKLCVLEVSVPTIDCRQELDALLFGNSHLDVRLQFVFGTGGTIHKCQWGFPTCIEESFFVHYFESVFRRISNDEREDDFVHVLYIRSVFEFFSPDDRPANATPPLDGKGFLQNYAGAVVDDGIEFTVYDAGSDSRRYNVLWASQDFRGSGCPRICDKLHYSRMFDRLNYYLVMRKDESVKPTGNNSCFVPLGLADWTICEANWEQRYAAKDWWPEYMRLRATRVDWFPFGY